MMATKNDIVLPEALGVPYGLIVFAVVLMAVAGFAGATWVERRFARPAAEATE